MGRSRRRGGEEGGAAAAPSPQRRSSVRPWSHGGLRQAPSTHGAPQRASRGCAGPAGARHGGLLPPPLRRLPPELRRWPSAPHPPPCAEAGRRPSPAPSTASVGGRGGLLRASAARGRASSPASFESAAESAVGPPSPCRSSASRARREQGGAPASLRPPSLTPPATLRPRVSRAPPPQAELELAPLRWPAATAARLRQLPASAGRAPRRPVRLLAAPRRREGERGAGRTLRRPVRPPAHATAVSPALAPPLLRLTRAKGSRGGRSSAEAKQGRGAAPRPRPRPMRRRGPRRPRARGRAWRARPRRAGTGAGTAAGRRPGRSPAEEKQGGERERDVGRESGQAGSHVTKPLPRHSNTGLVSARGGILHGLVSSRVWDVRFRNSRSKIGQS